MLHQYHVVFCRYNYDNEEFQHLLNSMNYTFENSGAKNAAASWLPVQLALPLIVSIVP